MNDQQRAAMQLALDALQYYKTPFDETEVDKAIITLRKVLTQPQLSKAATEFGLSELYEFQEATGCDTAAEYRALAQPQGSWVDLTDDEMQDCHCLNGTAYPFALAIIAKFKDKNTPPVVPQGEDDMMIAYMVGYEKGKDETKEKAAKVCDDLAEKDLNARSAFEVPSAADCAASIRSMK